MKLYTSTTSPTSRAIILTALAQGKDTLQLAYADPWTTPPELTAENPFSQVPVLITDDGVHIYNTLCVMPRKPPSLVTPPPCLSKSSRPTHWHVSSRKARRNTRTSRAPAPPLFAVWNVRHDLTRRATPSNSTCWQWHFPTPNCATPRSTRNLTRKTARHLPPTKRAPTCAPSAPKP